MASLTVVIAWVISEAAVGAVEVVEELLVGAARPFGAAEGA